MHLQPSEIVGVRSERVILDKLSEGVNERGLRLTGYLFLRVLFIVKGRLETTWTVLSKFLYANDLNLAEKLIPSSFKISPDQSEELTNGAISYLKRIFDLLDSDGECTTLISVLIYVASHN
ncbi:hypothetical protein NL676_034660 [Syzygium grande]|nr:hypothetical protein NL676_034660 [Syzygium grande]